ncbi:MAG: DUF6647 family protein [Burkholderiales bacterium]
MDSLSLAALALELLSSIHMLSGYPATTELPEIHRVPLADIQQRACKSSCRVQALYIPGEGVYIDEKFDLANDPFARSILLHELVHHQQQVKGAFQGIISDCDRWYAAESEAYSIQNRYLNSLNSLNRVYFRAIRVRCDQ